MPVSFPRCLVHLVVLVALLTTAAAALHAGPARLAPQAHDGLLDLRGWDFQRDGAVPLVGTWRWHPRRFIAADAPSGDAGAAPITVPGAWNGVTGQAQGFGSYELTIRCDRAERLALTVPAQHSAARWYLNGDLLQRQGEPGEDAGAERAVLGTRVLPLTGARCPMRLVVHLSNFQHAQGGMVLAPRLGDDAESALNRGHHLALDFALMGAFGLLGVLTLVFYLVRRSESTGLWFGLYCWSAMLYAGLANERLLERLVVQLPMAAHLRLEYLAWHAGMPLLLLCLRALYPRELAHRATSVLLWAGLLPLLVVAAMPLPLSSAWLPWLQWVTVAGAGWTLVRLGLAAQRRRQGAVAFLAGMLVFAALLLADTLQFGQRFEWQRAPFGMLAFVLAAAAAMSERLARALTAEELRGIEQRHRTNLLVRATKAGVLDWDLSTGRIVYSERYKDMLGHPADADTARWPGFFDQVHPDDRAAVRHAFDEQRRDRSVRGGFREHPALSLRLLRAGGQPLWVQAQGITLVGNDGRPLRYIGTFVDISHLKSTQDALATERERLALLVRSTKAGFGDWDAVNDVVTYSARFKEMLGHPADADTSGWPSIFELMHPEDRERARDEFRQMIRRKPLPGEQEPGEPMSYRLRRRDGSWVWIHAEGISQVDASGRTLRFITSYLDVTRFHVQEEALRQSHDQIAAQSEQLERQNEALKENVRLREDMERIGRHDLKTPLNTIIAVPRLLRERHHLGADDEELLGIVERAGLRILNLVNLSLDLFRMEQGRYDFRPQPVELLELLRTVVADVQPHAGTKGLQVVLRLDGGPLPPGTAVHAWAEELLCYSILANLLKNAVEAAPDGSTLTIDVRRGPTLSLSLHNHGAVPDSVRDRFFDKYATAGKSDGTGLGTYSAWLMARIQGGALQMRTSDDEGTTLTLTLQQAPAEQARAQQARQAGGLQPALVAPGDLPAWTVLVVDDDEFNLLVMRRHLPTPPLTVFTAVNGRAAVDQALQCQPDLVLIDLDMPVMDGLQATRRLRELQRQGALRAGRIVMLSSHDDDDTRRRALAAGCDHYLCKPVAKDVLLQALQWAAGRRPQPPLPVHPAPGSEPDAALSPDDPAAVAIDPELLDRMPAFLDSRRELLAALAQAAEQGDETAARRQAHRLAGSLGLYGLHWAAGQCGAIEHGGWTLAELHARLAALRTHLDGVQSRTQAAARAG